MPVHSEFVELPAFEKRREEYLDDEGFRQLQATLLQNPVIGDVIAGTGGLRKVRFADRRRGKGKRGGLRVIYYWWVVGLEFWLFAIYDKNEVSDLSPGQRKALRSMLIAELGARRKT